MKKFLTKAASQILEKHGNNLSRVLVLLPNQRSCTYFTNELKQLSTTAVFSPEVATLQGKMLELSPLVVIDAIELLTKLYAAHQRIGGALSLDEFIGLGHVLLDDFDELDVQMVKSKSFFRNLEMLQSMKVYEPGEEPGVMQLQYRKFWEDFGKMYESLREDLLAQDKGYRGMALRAVAEKPEVFFAETLTEFDAIYFVGFSGLNKTDETVIDFLRVHANVQMIWDGDVYYTQNEDKEAGYYFRKYKWKYRIGEKDWINTMTTRPISVDIVGTAKNIGQVKVVADILQNKLALTAADLAETVIIIPDEKLLAPLIANLPPNITEMNITMGVGMSGSLMATWLEILFRLQESAQKYSTADSRQRFYYKDVFDFLQHPFCAAQFSLKRADDFVSNMKRQNRVVIGASEIAKAFPALPTSVFTFYTHPKTFADFLAEQITGLSQLLITRHRAGDTQWDAEAEMAFRVQQILASAAQIFETGESLTLRTYIAMLREQLTKEKIALEGEPVKGLQLMGLQESRSLNFKNVIFLSANEGILPSGKQSNSYIPYELRKEFLTTHRERDSITAYLFYRLFHQAENVFLLYNTEPDELGGGEKSRFILQLQHELARENPNAKITDSVFAVDPPEALPAKDIVIAKTPEVLAHLRQLFSTSGISPSALNTYINCSLQYYFRYVAGIKEQDDMEESLDASTIGSAVHHALEEIYKEYLGRDLPLAYIEACRKDASLVQNLVREHLSERFDAESLSRGKNLLLFKVCVKLAEQFLQAEEERLRDFAAQNRPLRIVSLEEKLEAHVEVDGTAIKISGIADRIDKLDGALRIGDYKTTKVAKLKPLTEDLWEELWTNPDYSKTVQLLVYAWMYAQRDPASASALQSGIYWLRENAAGYDALTDPSGTQNLSADTLAVFETKLKTLLTEMLNPQLPFAQTEDTKRCTWCDFKNICSR